MHACSLCSRVQHAKEEVRQAFVFLHEVRGDAGKGERHSIRVSAEVVTRRVVHQLEGRGGMLEAKREKGEKEGCVHRIG